MLISRKEMEKTAGSNVIWMDSVGFLKVMNYYNSGLEIDYVHW